MGWVRVFEASAPSVDDGKRSERNRGAKKEEEPTAGSGRLVTHKSLPGLVLRVVTFLLQWDVLTGQKTTSEKRWVGQAGQSLEGTKRAALLPRN